MRRTVLALVMVTGTLPGWSLDHGEGTGLRADDAIAVRSLRPSDNADARFGVGAILEIPQQGFARFGFMSERGAEAPARLLHQDMRMRSLAEHARDLLALGMTQAQIAEAERRAREWAAEHEADD
jgi:hypothetical protein